MAKKITVIPASKTRFTSQPINSLKRRRTAGYARVSTDTEEQSTSYEAQMNHYRDYIQAQPDLEFVGMYSDEGISATSTAHRDGFNQMIADALDGKIDLIITKSVSRFARNTVDSLTTVRKLNEKGIEVYFEKENIRTLDSKGELLITIMSSLAQEESRSISENTTWGKRKKMEQGTAKSTYPNMLAFEYDPQGGLRINEKQAVIVRQIYKWFLDGYATTTIANRLTQMNIPTATGKEIWSPASINSILKNEKYKGDVLFQKTFTVDFLSKRQKKNEGELPQYYIEGNHEAIIDPITFDLVQAEFERRRTVGDRRYSGVSIFSSKIQCGDCGAWYGAKVWHSNSKYRKIIFQCNKKFDGEHKCTTPHLDEEKLKGLFIKAVNKLFANKDELINNAKIMMESVCDDSRQQTKLDELTIKQKGLIGVIEETIKENSRVACNQEEYSRRYEELVKQYEALQAQCEEVESIIRQKQIRRKQFNHFIDLMKNIDGICEEFDANLWGGLLERVIVYSKEDIRFVFRGGMEIKVK